MTAHADPVVANAHRNLGPWVAFVLLSLAVSLALYLGFRAEGKRETIERVERGACTTLTLKQCAFELYRALTPAQRNVVVRRLNRLERQLGRPIKNVGELRRLTRPERRRQARRQERPRQGGGRPTQPGPPLTGAPTAPTVPPPTATPSEPPPTTTPDPPAEPDPPPSVDVPPVEVPPLPPVDIPPIKVPQLPLPGPLCQLLQPVCARPLDR